MKHPRKQYLWDQNYEMRLNFNMNLLYFKVLLKALNSMSLKWYKFTFYEKLFYEYTI